MLTSHLTMNPLLPKTLTSAPPLIFHISRLSASTSNFHSHSHSHSPPPQTPSSSSSSSPSSRSHVDSVRVSVWWDFENCNIPTGGNALKVAHMITAAIRSSGIKGPIEITAFGDVLQLSRSNQMALAATGINMTHVPKGAKNSADRSLLFNLMYWVSQNPPPAHLFLISGDRDFATILHRLRMSNYNILLASPESAPDVLCSAASIMWCWHSLVKGENLTGKHYNLPPDDGPYGSSYSTCELPLKDPFRVSERQEKLQSLVPRSVVNQIAKVVRSFPEGIMITKLREELRKTNVYMSKDFYGHKSFSRFLLSMPHILTVRSEGEGLYTVMPVIEEPPATLDSNVGPSAENGEEKSIYTGADSEVICQKVASPEPDIEMTSHKVRQQAPSDQNVVEPPKGVDELHLTDKEAAEIPHEGVCNGLTAHQLDPASQDGLFKRLWTRWFRGAEYGSANEKIFSNSDHPATDFSKGMSGGANEECSTSNHPKIENKEKSSPLVAGPTPSSASNISQSAPIGVGVSALETAGDKCSESRGLFGWLMNWFRPGKRHIDFDSSNDCGSLDEVKKSHSTRNDLFIDDTCWTELTLFIGSTKGSATICRSQTREEMAENLQKYGPTVLKSLSKSDLLLLVDLLIVEKNLIQEDPSRKLPFKPVKQSSDCSNRLSSVFQRPSQHNRERIFQNASSAGDSMHVLNRKPTGRSRNNIFADCQELLSEILKESPGVYSIASFRQRFVSKYDYPPNAEELNYKKMRSLLMKMPQVTVESDHIYPSVKYSKPPDGENPVQNCQQSDDIVDSLLEELGPVADEDSSRKEAEPAYLAKATIQTADNSNSDCNDNLSEDDLSDSEDESTVAAQDGRAKQTAETEDSSLLEILDSWYSSKESNGKRDRMPGAHGAVDSSDGDQPSNLSAGAQGEIPMQCSGRKQRPQKAYSFVRDPPGSNKEKLIDGILDGLKNSSDPRMHG